MPLSFPFQRLHWTGFPGLSLPLTIFPGQTLPRIGHQCDNAGKTRISDLWAGLATPSTLFFLGLLQTSGVNGSPRVWARTGCLGVLGNDTCGCYQSVATGVKQPSWNSMSFGPTLKSLPQPWRELNWEGSFQAQWISVKEKSLGNKVGFCLFVVVF